MKPGEFVYNSIKTEAINKGADPEIAIDEARIGFAAYKENRFDKKPLDLILKHVTEAVSRTKRMASV